MGMFAFRAWLNYNTMFYKIFICFYVSEAKPLSFSLCSRMFDEMLNNVEYTTFKMFVTQMIAFIQGDSAGGSKLSEQTLPVLSDTPRKTKLNSETTMYFNRTIENFLDTLKHVIFLKDIIVVLVNKLRIVYNWTKQLALGITVKFLISTRHQYQHKEKITEDISGWILVTRVSWSTISQIAPWK